MAVPTAEVLRERPGPQPDEVERLNPELSTVQVGDRLRFLLQLPVLSPGYAREFLCTAFPFVCTPGVHLDLGEYLQPVPGTADFDYATGYMTVEADVIREASPGVPLLLVISALVIALAAIFPSVTVVLVERIKRATQIIGGAVGGIVGSVVGEVVRETAKGLGLSGIAVLLLVGAGLLVLSPQGQAWLQAQVALRRQNKEGREKEQP